MRPNPRLFALAWPMRTARRQTKLNDVTLAVSVTVSTTERSQVHRLEYGRELFGHGLLINGGIYSSRCRFSLLLVNLVDTAALICCFTVQVSCLGFWQFMTW